MMIFDRITDSLIPSTKESARIYRSKIGKLQGWISVYINSILFIVKFIIGLMAGSISVIADAIHTLSDVVSSIVVIWGFHESEKPADEEHPYGHGRVEYIATLIIAVLLCVAGIEFIEASIKRISSPEVITPDWWMILVLMGTVFIKEITARYAEFLSAKIASGTLHADAWHHRSDALSSLLVVGAMIAGKYGFYSLDGWAGIGIAFFLIYTGWTIAREAIDDLIGKPPTVEEVEEIRHLVTNLKGVLGVHDITVHSYGKDKFVSVHVEINANETPSQSHDIAENVENVLSDKLGAEPTVHMDPIQPGNPKVQEVQDYFDSAWSDDERVTDIHDIRIVETDDHKVIIFGINVQTGMTNKEMLDCCNKMENSIKENFQGFDVNIKVSPLHRY